MPQDAPLGWLDAVTLSHDGTADDVWHTAIAYINDYGEDAEMAAWKRADGLRALGLQDGSVFFRIVFAAISEFRHPRLDGDELLN